MYSSSVLMNRLQHAGRKGGFCLPFVSMAAQLQRATLRAAERKEISPCQPGSPKEFNGNQGGNGRSSPMGGSARRIGANGVSGVLGRLVQRAGAASKKAHLLGSGTPLSLIWKAGSQTCYPPHCPSQQPLWGAGEALQSSTDLGPLIRVCSKPPPQKALPFLTSPLSPCPIRPPTSRGGFHLSHKTSGFCKRNRI